MNSSALSQIHKARQALDAARTLDDIVSIRNKAEAVRHWAKTAGESLEAMNLAAELKLRAERKAGVLLAGMDKHRGRPPREQKPTTMGGILGDIGINYNQSHRWQLVAKVPEPEFEQYIADANTTGQELTSHGLRKIAARLKSPQAASKPDSVESYVGRVVNDVDVLQGVKFGTIYADPPWKYGNQSTRASTDNHYDTLSVDELCAMPVESLAADDSHLHLWTTNAFLFDAKQVMEAWGFEYRSCFVWVKPQMGIGNYWRVSHEFLLLGIRGNAKRFNVHNEMSWRKMERRKHSSKPEEMREVIERASPGPYLELFGRSQVPHWTVFGNQVEAKLFK